MKKLLGLLLFSTVVLAQSIPNGTVVQGQIWTPAQWNTAWQSKADTASPTLTGTPLINGVPIPTYPLTTGESAVGVTPANFIVAPCNINRYAVNSVPGTTDMSTAMNNALASCTNPGASVYVPAGKYLIGGIVIPHTLGLVIYGDGTSSVIVQKSTGSVLTYNTSSVFFSQGYIKNLQFVGSGGTANTIDTTGIGGLTLEDLYFTDVPTGADSIFVNGAAGAQTHDMRLRNIQIYFSSTSGGNAGIEFGSLASDTSVTDFIMNGGNGAVTYCLLYDSGAVGINLNNSHPYGCNTDIIKLAGGNNFSVFTHNVIDHSITGPLMSVASTSDLLLADNYFEAVQAGQNGLALINSSGVGLVNNMFLAVSGGGFAVVESGSSNNNSIYGGNIATLANWTAPVFSLIGANSSACAVPGVSNINCVAGTGANPTASLGLTAVNGSATTFMRSDAAPALNQSITPTWLSFHVFNGASAGAFAESLGVTATFGATATSRADVVIASPSTSAASFTIPTMDVFEAQFSTLGAGSAISNLIGYRADVSLAGKATNTYGFQSNLASAANTFNFYGGGTAPNFFAGGVELGSPTGGIPSAGQLNAIDVLVNNVSVTNGAGILSGTVASARLPASSVTLAGTSGSIGGGALIAGQCASGTATVTSATTSMVALADPNTYPGDGTVWDAQVTSANTVTVKVCAIIALTPTSSTYNVRVLQ